MGGATCWPHVAMQDFCPKSRAPLKRIRGPKRGEEIDNGMGGRRAVGVEVGREQEGGRDGGLEGSIIGMAWRQGRPNER